MRKLTSSPFCLPFVIAFLLVLGVAALGNGRQVSEAAGAPVERAQVPGLSAPRAYTATVYLPAVLNHFDPAQPVPTETRIVVDGEAGD